MPKVQVPVHQSVTVRLPVGEVSYRADVLDCSEEHILLRPEASLRSLPEAPRRLTLAFSDPNAVWELPAELQGVVGLWWIVSRPEQEACTSFQRRQHARVQVSMPLMAIPVNHQFHPDGAPFPVVLEDLSVSGCALSSQAPLTEGQRLVVVLRLPQAPEGIPVIAEILRVGEQRWGLRFSNMRLDHLEQIQAFIAGNLESGQLGPTQEGS